MSRAVAERPPEARKPAGGDDHPRRDAGVARLGGGGARSAGLAAALAVLVVAALASLAIGAKQIGLHDVLGAFFHFDDSDAQVIVRDLRGPRTLIGIAVGGALGAAGAIMQGVTRNPLADPGILGIEAGAALAVVLAIFLLGIGDVLSYAWFALAGATGAAFLVYGLGAGGQVGATPVTLALAGAAVTAMLSAFTSAIIVFDAATLNEFRFWVVGSIAGRNMEVLLGALPFLIVGLLLALASGRALNALSLGEDVARSLGQRVARAKLLAAVAVVALAGGAVSVAGPVGFVGLTVPHVARSLVGPDYRWLVPYSIVLGAILVLVADVVGRIVARPGEIQVGIVMAVIGAPVFVALVRSRKLAQL